MSIKPKKPIVKKPNLNSKAGKYFIAVRQGKPKTEAQLIAGYKDTQHSQEIEQSKTYQAIEQLHYKDELLKLITLAEIAQEQTKVIQQDKDLGAKNTAIKQALDKLEPEDNAPSPDKVMVILR